MGVEGELWQPAARGSRWVCQGDQTSGWDRAVWSLISVFIRYANSLPLEDYCHSNKEIVYLTQKSIQGRPTHDTRRRPTKANFPPPVRIFMAVAAKCA